MQIKDWRKFQHFKDRRPPWIKLYRDIIDDKEWFMLTGEQAKLLFFLWILASEDNTKEGNLPDIEVISWRYRSDIKTISHILSGLSHWLVDIPDFVKEFSSDIKLISTRYQLDTPETETETEKRERREEKTTTAVEEKFTVRDIQNLMRKYMGKLTISGGQIEIIRSIASTYTPDRIT